jgi:hypothetical protein
LERVFGRERKPSLEEASFIKGVRRPDDHDLPFIKIVVIDKSCREPLNRVFRELSELPTK